MPKKKAPDKPSMKQVAAPRVTAKSISSKKKTTAKKAATPPRPKRPTARPDVFATTQTPVVDLGTLGSRTDANFAELGDRIAADRRGKRTDGGVDAAAALGRLAEGYRRLLGDS